MTVSRFLTRLLAAATLLVAAMPARAQYQAIPDYSGTYAGKSFRTDINNRFSGAASITPLLGSVPFAALPQEADGKLVYCSDCQRSVPCRGGGTGAFALGSRGSWNCGNPPLEANLDASGFLIDQLGANQSLGDALSQGQSHLNDLAPATGGYSMGDNPLSGLSALSPGSDTKAQHTLAYFGVNGVIDPHDPYFGATASETTMTASLTSGSTSATVNSIGDFAVGQHVFIPQAGAPSTLAAVTNMSAVPYSYGDDGSGVMYYNGQYGLSLGCWVDNPASVPSWQANTAYSQNSEIQVPYNGQTYLAYASTGGTSGASAPSFANAFQAGCGGPDGTWCYNYGIADNTVRWTIFGLLPSSSASATNYNTGCSTSNVYSYEVVALDANGGMGVGATVSTTASAPAVLSATARIYVTWSPSGGAIAYAIFREASGQGSYTLYAVIPAEGGNTGTQSYWDMGGGGWAYYETVSGAMSQALPTLPTNDNLLATITAISGTTVTLSGAPSVTTASAIVRHDDAPAIQAAVAQYCGNNGVSGEVYLPAGDYPLGETISLLGCVGLYLHGAGTNYGTTLPATNLDWHGPLGATVFNLNKTYNVRIERLALAGENSGTPSLADGSTPGVGMDIDNYTASGAIGPAPATTHDMARNVTFGDMATDIRIAERGTGNSENMIFEHLDMGTEGGGWQAVRINGSANTDLERFVDLEVGGGWDEVFDLGSIGMVGTVVAEKVLFSFNRIGVAIHNFTKGLMLRDWYVEGPQQLIYSDIGNGSTTPVYLDNVQAGHGQDPPSNGIFIVDRNLLLNIANSVIGEFSGNNSAPFKVSLTNAAVGTSNGFLISTQNVYVDPNPFLLRSNAPLTSYGDTTRLPGNGASYTSLATGPAFFTTPLNFNQGLQHLQITAIGTPPTPTCQVGGTAGSTTYYYAVVGHSANGGLTPVSAACTISTGNATLSSSNFNKIILPSTPTSAIAWDVLKSNSSATGPWSLLMTAGPGGHQDSNVLDTGQTPLASSYTVPSRDSTGDLSVAGMFTEGCAGTVTLSSGAATVTNSCITGARPVLCTDQTGANAVKCAPSSGSLSVAGTGSDVVSWGQM